LRRKGPELPMAEGGEAIGAAEVCKGGVDGGSWAVVEQMANDGPREIVENLDRQLTTVGRQVTFCS
jgi:hypothetical protein